MTITTQAEQIVFGDREETYGNPSTNFERIARFWDGYLTERLSPGQKITPKDVAFMMDLLKTAREMNKSTWDGILDKVGYMACCSRLPEYEGLNPRKEPKRNPANFHDGIRVRLKENGKEATVFGCYDSGFSVRYDNGLVDVYGHLGETCFDVVPIERDSPPTERPFMTGDLLNWIAQASMDRVTATAKSGFIYGDRLVAWEYADQYELVAECRFPLHSNIRERATGIVSTVTEVRTTGFSFDSECGCGGACTWELADRFEVVG